MEKRTFTKENSHPITDERSSKFRNNHSMAILGVPDIGVLKLIDVHIQPVIGVEVHIGNEKMCDEPSRPPSLECSRDCILFGT